MPVLPPPGACQRPIRIAAPTPWRSLLSVLLYSSPRLSGVGRQVRTHTQFGKPWLGKREPHDP